MPKSVNALANANVQNAPNMPQKIGKQISQKSGHPDQCESPGAQSLTVCLRLERRGGAQAGRAGQAPAAQSLPAVKRDHTCKCKCKSYQHIIYLAKRGHRCRFIQNTWDVMGDKSGRTYTCAESSMSKDISPPAKYAETLFQ